MTEKYVLIVFDTDGTLVETASGETFRKEASDWQWLPARREVLQALRQRGMRIAVATNQGGVAFGYMEADDILHELERMCAEAGIPRGGLYICYNHPAATDPRFRLADYRRKPNPGMLLDAMEDFEATPEETLMVGDRKEDEEAAKNAGCDFVWANIFFSGEMQS